MKTRIFLTHDGITDSINGWAKRLDLHPAYFRKRTVIYKDCPSKLFAYRVKTGPIKSQKGDKNPNYRHGLGKTKAYDVWGDMMRRCYNINCKSYERYGGRGITVCKRWHELKNFYEDMGDPPKGLTIERKNNNKGYSKANCKWATYKEQAANRRPRSPNKSKAPCHLLSEKSVSG